MMPPPQTPPWHVSPVMQRFPLLQVVPLAAAGLEQRPVLGSQVPATWHWSDALQTTGLLPVQKPLWHVSLWVQAFPSLQVVPSASAWGTHIPPIHATV
jgi:hypothetical protein